jgi:multidrug efflux pump subunit AcrA (membrane-fusion protein)
VLTAVGALVFLALVAGGTFLIAGPGGGEKDLVLHTVTREPLMVTIVERGAVESADNGEIICPVKANKGGTFATTIKDLPVEDGQYVKKGQLLIELDSASIQDQLDTETITKDNAKLAWDKAEGDLLIQLSQNESDIETAENTLALAAIDLEKYIKGDYPQSLEDLNNRWEQAKERVAYSNRMVKKGYISTAQALADLFALQKIEKEAVVLELTKKRTITDYESKLRVAKESLRRTKQQAKTKEETATKTRDNSKSVYTQELSRCKDFQAEIGKCKLYAPRDGIVVYVVPEQARWGVGSRQSVVAQGETVSERQKLMKIPNLEKMQVNIKIHEALYASVHKGQSALIKIEALHDKVFHGRVESVATVDSKQDFMAADVKVYQTIVSIDPKEIKRLGPDERMTPGLSAEVSILVNRTRKPVLTVPVGAIVESSEDPEQRAVFVAEPGGVVERPVEIGLANEEKAEVRFGLKEGEKVVLNHAEFRKDKKSGKRSGKRGKKEKQAEFRPGPLGGTLPSQQTGVPGAPGAKAPGTKLPGPGAPGAQKPAPRGPKSFADMTPEEQQQAREQMKKDWEAMVKRFKAAPPPLRKKMLGRLEIPPMFRAFIKDPAQYRAGVKDRLKGEGVDIPD